MDDAIALIKKLAHEMSPRYFTIFDACFGLNKKWRKAFLSALAQAELNCYFWLETRVDVIDEEDLELMSRLKIKMDFGIDSFSTSMLKIMNKTIDPNAFLKKFVKISSICNQLDILHDVYLIFDHPGETRETYAEFRQFFQEVVTPQLEGGHLRVKYQRFHFTRATILSTIWRCSQESTVSKPMIRSGGNRKGTTIYAPGMWCLPSMKTAGLSTYP